METKEIEKVNYFFKKEDCKIFLEQFDFNYEIPNLDHEYYSYCVKLKDDLTKVESCSRAICCSTSGVDDEYFYENQFNAYYVQYLSKLEKKL